MHNPLRRELLKTLGLSATMLSLPFAGRATRAAAAAVNIGIIGSGHVGSTLGRVWAGAGHAVMFSSENLAHDKELAGQVGANAQAGTPAEAAAFGEVLLFAVPYRALPDLGKSLAASLKGKVVLDACNPFASRDGAIAERASAEGAGLLSAQLLPGARIVRAFNAVSAARMGQAHEDPGHFGMPIAAGRPSTLPPASSMRSATSPSWSVASPWAST